ncbi:MAG: glycosyltransferase [Spirochaetes bacterium]|nr:glycosyltransferase [Spirochaetota bacterium]
MKKKRIAFYCDVMIYGGHEMMSARIANAISEYCEVAFLFSHEMFDRDLTSPVRRLPLPGRMTGTGLFNLLIRSWPELFAIRRILRSFDPDIVIVVQGEYRLCLKGLFAARIAGKIRAVSYIPNGHPYVIDRMRFAALMSRVYRAIVNLFHAFITISEEQKLLIRRFAGSRRPIHVLENQVDFPHLRRKRTLGRPIRIGIIGRIQRSKGQYRAVDIAKRLCRVRNDFQFVFYGEGDDEPVLKKKIADGALGPFFDFQGWTDDKARIYAGIDVVLILSELEGVPLVLLEALYLGKPVFARRLPENPIYERYLDADFIFSTDEELIEKLINLERFLASFKRKADHARKIVIDRHGMNTFTRRTREVLDLL